MKEPNAITKWLDSPVAHIATASFIAAGMIAAMMVKLLLHDPHILNIVLLVAIAGASVPLLLSLAQQVFKGNFSVDILALLSIVTSLVLGQYWVAAIVVLMLSGGQALEGFATRRASSVLNALAKRMPQTAHRAGTAVEDVSIDTIVVGDELLIYPHEICPVDGLVVSGQGSMDESYLTGEPFLIAKAPGANVLSGSINGNVALTIRATKIASDSRYAKIVEVLHASEENGPQIQRLGDRLGSWYTPMAITIALASWYFSGQSERFLAVLVIATPCPLLISIPVAIIGAISVGAKLGIIIKDPSILEKMDTCHTLIVDKTGTLTYGKPTVTSIDCFGGTTRETALQYVASLERYSKHPLASAVLAAAEKGKLELVELVRETTLQGRTLYIGDGINDAPAMMAATAGIALGVNSDITSEAAGAVILQSSLVSVDQLMHIGRRMRGIALVSAVGGMGLSLIGMAGASFGLITPIQGAVAQEVIDLLSILNSLRMILPTGSLTDFEASPEGIVQVSTGDAVVL